MALDGVLQVVVVYSPGPREAVEWQVRLPAGATVRQAVQASGLAQAFPHFHPLQGDVGVWGRRVDWQHPLREGDRVELYRPLRVDPKVARRERFQRQGARATGLFAQRRPGAKPGY